MTQPPNGDGGGLGSLRWDAYVAAPDEQVLRLSVASSLFPHLPLRSRNVFRVGLAVLFLLLIALGLLRWQAPMIAVSALGLPMMFLIYLYEANVHRDLTLRVLVPTALLGIGLGVGWALATGSLVAGFYDVSLANASSRRLAQLVGVTVPVGGAILMLVPAVVMRLFRLHAGVVGRLRNRVAERDQLHRRGHSVPDGAAIRDRGHGRRSARHRDAGASGRARRRDPVDRRRPWADWSERRCGSAGGSRWCTACWRPWCCSPRSACGRPPRTGGYGLRCPSHVRRHRTAGAANWTAVFPAP